MFSRELQIDKCEKYCIVQLVSSYSHNHIKSCCNDQLTLRNI